MNISNVSWNDIDIQDPKIFDNFFWQKDLSPEDWSPSSHGGCIEKGWRGHHVDEMQAEKKRYQVQPSGLGGILHGYSWGEVGCLRYGWEDDENVVFVM